jgi:F-type H+-transporting ATPase subunit alpha
VTVFWAAWWTRWESPLDGGPQPQFNRRRALEVGSPPITARDFVRRPLLSGNKMVDTMIPIGKGQRQLIIGDAGTGKSSLAMDTIIAQKGAMSSASMC